MGAFESWNNINMPYNILYLDLLAGIGTVRAAAWWPEVGRVPSAARSDIGWAEFEVDAEDLAERRRGIAPWDAAAASWAALIAAAVWPPAAVGCAALAEVLLRLGLLPFQGIKLLREQN